MKFSIIVPVYNVVAYLPDCLDSLLDQTFGDWEAICIDDGSTDGSGAILDIYARHDGRFVVIHQQNGGVSAARNAGLAVVRGDYVGFVDADDCLSRDWLKTVDSMISQYPCDLYHFKYTECRVISKEELEQVYCNAAASGVRCSNAEAAVLAALACAFDDGYSFLFFVRREVLSGLTYPVGVWMHEDCLFFAQVALRVANFCSSCYAGYLYRFRETSACARSELTDGFEYLDVAQRIVDVYEHNVDAFIARGVGERAFDVFSSAVVRRLAVCVERCLAVKYPGNAGETIARVEALFRNSAFHRKPSRFRLPIERNRYKLVRRARMIYRFRVLIRLKRVMTARVRRTVKVMLGRG